VNVQTVQILNALQLDPPPTGRLFLAVPYTIYLYLHEYANLDDLDLWDSVSNPTGVVSIINDDLKGKVYREEDSIDERSITERSWPLQ